VLGIAVGAGLSWIIHAASQLPTYVSLWSVATAILFSAMVGIFFGLYPAMRASRLDPVDSLRYE
jgi:putative ABC transport system permease protein